LRVYSTFSAFSAGAASSTSEGSTVVSGPAATISAEGRGISACVSEGSPVPATALSPTRSSVSDSALLPPAGRVAFRALEAPSCSWRSS
jgi:hypothetical protein